MPNEQYVESYDILCKDISLFLKLIIGESQIDFEVTIKEIEEIQSLCGNPLKGLIRSLLVHLGNVPWGKVNIEFVSSFKDIQNAYRVGIQSADRRYKYSFDRNIIQEIKSSKTVKMEEREITGDLTDGFCTESEMNENKNYFGDKDILLLEYCDNGDHFPFITLNQDNPIYYIYWGEGNITGNNSVEGMTRGSLLDFLFEKKKFKQRRQIPWFKYYQNVGVKSTADFPCRDSFAKQIEQSGKILTIDAYELEFIKYLMNHYPNTYKHPTFNPDDYMGCDFREYLK